MSTPSLLQIFFTFLQLGCLSFGGPAAHLVFFQRKFVQDLTWLSPSQYNQLVALAQLLPGPSSSQVGLAIGFVKHGYIGACVAWLGFTLPSALFMAIVAVIGQHYFDVLSSDSFHVIQLIVLSVVIWAFWQMMRSFCSNIWHYALMILAAMFMLVNQFALNQVLLIFVAGLLGILIARLSTQAKTSTPSPANSDVIQVSSLQQKLAPFWLLAFLIPLFFLPVFANYWNISGLGFFADFFQTGSMVFGGGHVVLPLLHQDTVSTGLVSAEHFDLGYALVQLMPGPLFTFASYLGALLPWTESIWQNSLLATLAIFLPSFLLIFASLPYWSWLMQQATIRHAVVGINVAVVGLLLYMVIVMFKDYTHQFEDFIFLALMLALLKSKLPVSLSLIAGFVIYSAYLHLF